MVKPLKPIGQMGTGKGAKVLYQKPANVKVTPQGQVAIDVNPTVVGPGEENPADAALKDAQRKKIEGESGRTGGFKFKEFSAEQEKLITDHIRSVLKIKDVYKKYSMNKNKFGAYIGPVKGMTPKFIRKQLSPDFDVFLESEVKPVLSTYLHTETGAARGFTEMQWYTPVFPESTDTKRGFELKIKTNVDNGVRDIKRWANQYTALGYNPETIKRLIRTLYVTPGAK